MAKIMKVNGSLKVNQSIIAEGDLLVKGTTTSVAQENLLIKDNLVVVAKDNTTALVTPAGLLAKKYDGTNDGALVFDADGTAYIGDVALNTDGTINTSNSDLQPLATREEEPTAGGFAKWDSSTKKFVTDADVASLTKLKKAAHSLVLSGTSLLLKDANEADAALSTITQTDLRTAIATGVSANESSFIFPKYNSTGLITGAAATAKQKAMTLNGTSLGSVYGTSDTGLTLYAPTGSGDNNQVLISKGANNAPVWVNQSDLAAGKATNDKDGNAIDTTYLKKSGGSMTGSIRLATNTAIGSSDGKNLISWFNDAKVVYVGETDKTMYIQGSTDRPNYVNSKNETKNLALLTDVNTCLALDGSRTMTGNIVLSNSKGLVSSDGTNVIYTEGPNGNIYIGSLDKGLGLRSKDAKPFYIDEDNNITSFALMTDIPDVSNYLPLSGGIIKGTLAVNTYSADTNAQEPFYVQGTPTQSVSWVAGFKNPFNGDAQNYGTGIRLRNGGNTEHAKWSGIVSHADSSYSNVSRLELWANKGSAKYKFHDAGVLKVTNSSDALTTFTIKNFTAIEGNLKTSYIYGTLNDKPMLYDDGTYNVLGNASRQLHFFTTNSELKHNRNGTYYDIITKYNIGSQSVASATKATNDSDGNAINTTYLKKSGGTISGDLSVTGQVKFPNDVPTNNSPAWVYVCNENNARNGFAAVSLSQLKACMNLTDHFKLVLRIGGSFNSTDSIADAIMSNFSAGEEGAILFAYGSGDSEKRFLSYFRVKGRDGEWRQCDIHIGWNSGTSEKYISCYDSYGYYGSTNSSGLTMGASNLHALQIFGRVSS